jgi:hypothetical protein
VSKTLKSESWILDGNSELAIKTEDPVLDGNSELAMKTEEPTVEIAESVNCVTRVVFR